MRKLRAGNAIKRIVDNGMAVAGQVDADLMGAPRLKLAADQFIASFAGNDFSFGFRFLSGFRETVSACHVTVPADLLFIGEMLANPASSGGNRKIFAVDFPFFQHRIKPGLKERNLYKQNKTGRIPVEAVNETDRRLDAMVALPCGSLAGKTVRIVGIVDNGSRILMGDIDEVVFINDGAGSLCRGVVDLLLWQKNGDDVPCLEGLIFIVDLCPVDEDLAVLDGEVACLLSDMEVIEEVADRLSVKFLLCIDIDAAVFQFILHDRFSFENSYFPSGILLCCG